MSTDEERERGARTPSFNRRAFIGAGAAATAAIAFGVGRAADGDSRHPARSSTREVDVLVVGANVAGIAAALEVVAAGLTVALLEQSSHVGGLTTGGISNADIGDAATIGGFSKRMFADIELASGAGAAAYKFAPDVAQRVLDDYLARAHVVPQLNQWVVGVHHTGGRWIVRTASGRVYSAACVIDATYEGDVIARAGVKFRLGRENSTVFHESLAGVRPALDYGLDIDPYLALSGTARPLLPGAPVTAGAGALLPGVQATPGQIGAGSRLIQAPAYRLVLTVAADRQAITAPPGYQASDYELVTRFTQAGGNALPNELSIPGDSRELVAINGGGLVSIDLTRFGGLSWVNAHRQHRPGLAQLYRDWTVGFLWHLATNPGVPSKTQGIAQTLGFVPGLWPETGGFPPALYVREGRRLVGRQTLTQAHVLGTATLPNPVALGSYQIDAHHAHYVVDAAGHVAGEGGIFHDAAVFPIPLGSLLPRAAPPGLIAAVPISTSHVAWSSVRVEGVFGMLGQAAGALAGLAVKTKRAPSDVPYATLEAALVAGGAILERPA